MEKVRILPATVGRVESGAIQFGEEDWPGLFIRGDNCIYLYTVLNTLLEVVMTEEQKNTYQGTVSYISNFANMIRDEVIVRPNAESDNLPEEY